MRVVTEMGRATGVGALEFLWLVVAEPLDKFDGLVAQHGVHFGARRDVLFGFGFAHFLTLRLGVSMSPSAMTGLRRIASM